MSIDWEQVTKHEVDRSKWPMMVQLGLWGLRSRAAARGVFWLCLAMAAGCPPMVLAALWIHLSIRWVDHHGGWEVTPAPGDAPRAAAYPAAGLNPSREVTPAAPPAPPALSFVPFTDPMVGGFILDVPRGWQVRGGLNHAGLGDRRWFVEAQSPDGITVMLGDPNCPQAFCHNSMAIEDVMIPSPTTGCTNLNIPPQAKRLASYYFQNVAPQRFGPLKITGQRDRNDMVAEEINRIQRQGIAVAKSYKMSVHEIQFETGGRIGCCFATIMHDTAYSFALLGLTFSQGTVNIWLAPPALTAVAEQVLTQMRNTFRPTPRAPEVWQRDEMLIASNGMAANLNQQIWFQGQQAVHQAQVAQGDAIVNYYWQQQRVNDGITQRYWDAQHTNDRLSQDRSDAMLDRQRLCDDRMGRTYDASAGYNYYWLDQQSGQIVGTNTSDPPDYQRNYTALRKL